MLCVCVPTKCWCAEYHYVVCATMVIIKLSFVLSVGMRIVIMRSVVIPSVVAPN